MGSTCPTCCLTKETTIHVLWNCPAAQDVWCQACVKLQKISFQHFNFTDIWHLLSNKLTNVELSETAILMRLLWHRGNEAMHGKPFQHHNLLSKLQ